MMSALIRLLFVVSAINMSVAITRRLEENDIESIELGPFTSNPCEEGWICPEPEGIEFDSDMLLKQTGGQSILRSPAALSTASGIVRIESQFIRDETCDNHLLMLSTSATQEWNFDFQPNVIQVVWQCEELYLVGETDFEGTVCDLTKTMELHLEVTQSKTSLHVDSADGSCDLSIALGFDAFDAPSVYFYFGTTREDDDGSTEWSRVATYTFGAPTFKPTTAFPTVSNAPSEFPTAQPTLVPTLTPQPSSPASSTAPTSAPICAVTSSDPASFLLVGGAEQRRRGTYVLDKDPCGCRPQYVCIDCAINSHVFYDPAVNGWWATSGGCNEVDDDGDALRAVSPDSVALRPFEIGEPWYNLDPEGSGQYLLNSTLEVVYSIELYASSLFDTSLNSGLLGAYERRGLCDQRPAFFLEESYYMYYIAQIGFWVVGAEGCGSLDNIFFYAIDNSKSPLQIPAEIWFEAVDGEAKANPFVGIRSISQAPTLSPTVSPAPSVSPPPSVSASPSTAVPSMAPQFQIELFVGGINPCETNNWICAENTRFEPPALLVTEGASISPLVRGVRGFQVHRDLRITGSLTKDRVCSNHILIISALIVEGVSTIEARNGFITIAFDCDELIVQGFGANAKDQVSCGQDWYDFDASITEESTTVRFLGSTGVECFIELNDGFNSLVADESTSILQKDVVYVYIGGEEEAKWTNFRAWENLENAVTTLPTAFVPRYGVTLSPTYAPRASLSQVSCSFETDTCAWANGGIGVYGWRRSLTRGLGATLNTGPSTQWSGYFMWVAASASLVPNGGPFVLESPRFPPLEEGGFLLFRYHMFGSQMGMLWIEAILPSDIASVADVSRTIWSRSGDQGDIWHLANAQIPEGATRLRIMAQTGAGSLSDIAIDEVIATLNSPTVAPSAIPSASPAPTITMHPTITLLPTITPTNLETVETRAEIQAAILTRDLVYIARDTIVDFSAGLIIITAGEIRVAGADPTHPAILDGNGNQRIFAVLGPGSLTLQDLVIRNGYSSDFGGALVATEAGFLRLQSCVVHSSSAVSGGGAIFAQAASTVEIFDSFLLENSSKERGGAILLRSGSRLVLRATEILENNATDGGGVFIEDTSTIHARHSIWVQNLAVFRGGGLFLFMSEGNIEDCVFELNRAVQGGGVFVDNSRLLTITASRLYMNSATQFGGGIRVDGSSNLVSENSTFERNIVTGEDDPNFAEGGAVLVFNSATFTARNSNFLFNEAPNGAAIRMELKAVASLDSCTFQGNFASSDPSSSWIKCSVSSTLYSALVNLDEDQQLSANGCSGFIYKVNNDGSLEHLESTLAEILVEPGSILVTHYTFPCRAGTYSLDGLEHGDILDRNGQTINDNDITCSDSDCYEPCATCPTGKYSPFSLDRFRLATVQSCIDCPVGRALSDNTTDPSKHDDLSDCLVCTPGKYAPETGLSECLPCSKGTFADDYGSIFCSAAPAGSFVDKVGSSFVTACPAGRYSVGGASECVDCEPGTFQDAAGQTSCTLAPPGSFAPDFGATGVELCPPGTISLNGQFECELCPLGEWNDEYGQSECRLTSPGKFVNESGSSNQMDCPPGYYSEGGRIEECRACPAGTFNYQSSQGACLQCPWPTSTMSSASTACDACIAGFYWDTVFYENNRVEIESMPAEPCVDCCVECDSIDNSGVECLHPGILLETIPVTKGWWRPTRLSTEVYRCDWEDACKGGNDTSRQCARAYTGAVCGACRQGYDRDPVKEKCIACRPALRVTASPGTLIIIIIIVLCFAFLVRRIGMFRIANVIKTTALDVLTDKMDPRHAERRTIAFAKGQDSSLQTVTNIDIEKEEAVEKSYLTRSIMTKAKICFAAYQIASVTPWSLPAVNFPAPTTAFLKVASIFEFNFVQLGSTDCILKLNYFEKLVVVTTLPFALAIVGTLLYYGTVKLRRYSGQMIDNALEKRRVHYCILLLFYVFLPGCSTYTLRYFSCLRYERGVGRSYLKVLAIDPTIRCSSNRYHRWLPYVIFSLIIWPIGCPLVVGITLWSRRHRLNPQISSIAHTLGAVPYGLVKKQNEELLEETERSHNNYRWHIRQIVKIEQREKDIELRALLFLYEEYLPHYYLFPVYEAVRRVFLTGVLAMFYPGSLAQVAIGLFGSMISYKIFNACNPFVDNNDNIVSEVAQIQLVLIFFAATIVFASENLDAKEGIFRSEFFAGFIIIVIVSSLCTAIYFVLVNVWGYAELRKKFVKKWARSKSLASISRDDLEDSDSEHDEREKVDEYCEEKKIEMEDEHKISDEISEMRLLGNDEELSENGEEATVPIHPDRPTDEV